MSEPTEQLIAELEALIESTDTEDAHSRADRIVLALLGRALSPRDVQRVCKAWEALPKWYA